MSEEISPYVRLIGRVGTTRHPGGLKLSELLLNRIGIERNFRILDVGCGAGHSASHIAQHYGCSVVGIDLSEAALSHARALYGNEPYASRLSFIKAELSHLPFSDDYFDVVICESVLIFVKDKAQGLTEMGRVCKPKGFLLLNEICVAQNDQEQRIKEYFARSEMGAFLLNVDALSSLINSETWNIVVHDEQIFSLKEQFKADLAQFGNKKGLLQILELMHGALTDKKTREDLWSLGKYLLSMPPQIMKSLRILAILAQKNALTTKAKRSA